MGMADTSSTKSAMYWQLRHTRLALKRQPLLMGIVNVTPDSFSDGGMFLNPERAVQHALELVDAGADILDIGGESTRPYSTPITPEEELRRVMPVLRGVRRQCPVPMSIDTSKAAVARAAIDESVQIINDVTGLEGDPEMLPLAARSDAAVCVMHMQGTPATMQHRPSYGNVVEEVRAYLAARLATLLHAGVAADHICLDPGIGFGKTLAHNLQLLQHCRRFKDLGCPLLIGHSRKGFIGQVLGDGDADRTAGTIGVALALAAAGVNVLRVHDMRPVRQALQLFAAAGGLESREPLT